MRGSEPVTEHREALHADIDLLSTIELVELVNDEDARVAPAVRETAPHSLSRSTRSSSDSSKAAGWSTSAPAPPAA